jgi:hypothetical protein
MTLEVTSGKKMKEKIERNDITAKSGDEAGGLISIKPPQNTYAHY